MEIDDILSSGWPPTDQTLAALLEEACVDAYNEYEQTTGMHCIFEEWGGFPCPAVVCGQRATLVDVDLREATLVGMVRFAQARPVPVPLEDVVPQPGTPAAFMVAMYRLWRNERPLVVEVELPAVDAAQGWPAVRERLAALDGSAMTELVGALYAASVGNRRRIHKALGLPAPEAPDRA